MLEISRNVAIREDEIEITAIRASGPGGQHGDRAATAVQLRFDIPASSLPDPYRQRLLRLSDHRINRDGVVVIKAQEYRSRARNEEAARERLCALIRSVAHSPRPRRPTGPSRAARMRRLQHKRERGRTKALRKPPRGDQ